MATRNLTRGFVQMRIDAKERSARRRHISGDRAPEGSSLMRDVDARDWEASRQALPPIWVDSVDEVNEDISKIKDKVEELQRLHTKRLMVRFDTNELDIEEQIERKTSEITTLFRHAERVLKRFSTPDPNRANAAAGKTRQNIQRALAIQLQSLSADFRKSQKDYLGRVKKQKQGPAEFDFLSQETSKKSTFDDVDSGFSQAQLTEVELAEDLINERDSEIQQIATSIEELATIFKELAVLVIDQGTILDRIDYNMEQVEETVEQGLIQLEKAEKTQKSNRPMKCIGCLILTNCALIAILVLKNMNQNN